MSTTVHDNEAEMNIDTTINDCDQKSLNAEQKKVVEHVMKEQDVMITGSAGTGKSFLVKHLREQFDRKNIEYAVLAPTGIAAVNIGGQTIHRFLGIRPDIKTLEDYKRSCMKK